MLPSINADDVERKRKEEERVAFLRQCAIQNAGLMREVVTTKASSVAGSREPRIFSITEQRAEAAQEIVREWSALFDAIEATRSK